MSLASHSQETATRSFSAIDSPADSALPKGARSCAHCSSPVPTPLLLQRQRDEQFCCAGCETVYHLLKSAGLEDYYDYRDRIGEPSSPVRVTSSFHEEFDTASYHNLYCRSNADGTVSTSFILDGVHCAACVWLVERVGRVEPAVSSARLDFAQARVELTYDPKLAPLSRVAGAFRGLGYTPRPFRAREAETARRKELRSLLIRMGVAGATAGNVMLMAFALYSGAVGLDESQTMDHITRRYFEVLSLVVSLPALFAAGIFFRGAWASLRTRTPHMDLPIALGIAGGFVWGAYGALTGRGELYFDSITTLVFFLLFGRYVQRRHQMAFSEAAELVHAVLPSTATTVDGDESDVFGETPRPELLRTISRDEITEKTKLWVKSGAVVPVDGRITSGRLMLDKSLISGEARPISVETGDFVEAGALNLGRGLLIEAIGDPNESRVVRLMGEVQRALSTRTPLTSQADSLAGAFIVGVILTAGVVAVAWWHVSPHMAFERALSLLIVACPCALGLATPLALSAAVRSAAKGKKLIFSPEAIEQLGRKGDLVLDKTGTLTVGSMSVLAYEGEHDVLPAVTLMEREARHPVARAICDFGEQTVRSWTEPPIETTELGCEGLRASWGESTIVIGSERLIRGCVEGFEADLAALQKGKVPAEASPIYVARGGRVVGRFWIGDELRPDAASSLAQLKRMGYRLHLLSGDNRTTVLAVAEQLAQATYDPNLFETVSGDASPERKLEFISELKSRRGRTGQKRGVFMVGDGINDAGALALADVGIAVDGAAEASRMSAQVYLARPGVGELLSLSRGSRRTLSAIRRGIVFSLVYNFVGIACAGLGLLGPLGAAVLMPLSSLTVVTNAYRSRTFSESPSLWLFRRGFKPNKDKK